MRVRRTRRQLAGALAVAVAGLASLAVSPSASASPTHTAAHTAAQTAETAGKPSFADHAYNPAFRHPGVAITRTDNLLLSAADCPTE
jgi:hypothetical protein